MTSDNSIYPSLIQNKEDQISLKSPSVTQQLNSPTATLNELFGFDLVNYYNTYFFPFLFGAKYTWNSNSCQLENLKVWINNNSGFQEESEEIELSNIFSENFAHSFTMSRGILKEDDLEETGIEYIKKIFENSVKVNDLFRFYEGSYMGEGIINAYLKILEVFHEFLIAKTG